MTPTTSRLLEAIETLDYNAYDAPRFGDIADGTWECALRQIEREAAALDVELLARALDKYVMPLRGVDIPVDAIAREYEKLRTPEGEG